MRITWDERGRRGASSGWMQQTRPGSTSGDCRVDARDEARLSNGTTCSRGPWTRSIRRTEVTRRPTFSAQSVATRVVVPVGRSRIERGRSASWLVDRPSGSVRARERPSAGLATNRVAGYDCQPLTYRRDHRCQLPITAPGRVPHRRRPHVLSYRMVVPPPCPRLGIRASIEYLLKMKRPRWAMIGQRDSFDGV